MSKLSTNCAIAGGGPAGLMLGYLLALRGVEVVVLEKHRDFLRDFRGDTVHPSTLQIFHDLGLDEQLLSRPHQRTEAASVNFPEGEFELVDFTRLGDMTHKFIAMMPQWDFLDFLREQAEQLPGFKLLMETRAVDLIEQDGSVRGIRAIGPEGELAISAGLTVAADGRRSILRDLSDLPVEDVGAPIDVLWFRVPRTGKTEDKSLASLGPGGMLVLINRGDYWQCAMPIPKGLFTDIQSEGLLAFRQRVVSCAPDLAGELDALDDWEQVRMLNVQVDRLRRWWKPGFLCIGDAAHAMSPVGGVGVNLAIQDATATARMLGPALKSDGAVGTTLLRQVEDRRKFPAVATQWAQVQFHKRFIEPIFDDETEDVAAPGFLDLVGGSGVLRGLLGRAIGVGVRPEHWPK